MRVAWYFFILALARGVFRLMGGLRPQQESLVPRSGPVLVAPTHFSHFDPPAVACATNRKLAFMAKEELFKVPVLGALIRSLGAFPVKRGDGDTEAFRRTIRLLEAGEAVLLFPEGTRGDAEHLGAINRGVTLLARRTGAQVVPVAIVGTHRMFPKGAKKPKRGRIVVRFGEPFKATELPKGRAFEDELRDRLLALSAEAGLPLRIGPTSERPSSDQKGLSSSEAPSLDAAETPSQPAD